MENVKINKVQAIQELARRVRRNENGVKHYLQSAGITVDGRDISLDDLKSLNELNPQAFSDMCHFLFPELPTKEIIVNGDGSKKTSEPGAKVTDENGAVVTQTAGSSVDWTSVLSGIVSTAGMTLTGIFAKQQDNSAIAAYQQQKADMKLILGVVAVAVVIILAFVFLVIKRKK